MKPKTTLQKEVVRLSKQLPKITLTQMKYANKHALDHLVYINKSGTHNCMDCGHSWKGIKIDKSPQWHKDIVKEYVDCPSCNESLLKIGTQTRTATDHSSMQIISVSKGFQVIRMFEIRSSHKTKTVRKIWHIAVGEIWIHPDGRHEYIGLNRSGYNANWWGAFEVKHKNSAGHINFEPYVTYPKINIIPEIYRNGFYDKLLGFKPFDLFKALLTSHIAETLIKEDEFDLLKQHVPLSDHCRVVQYWDSIKIALRHRYKPHSVGDYLDYLRYLDIYDKDMRSPKYVCPRDLHEAHQYYVERERKKRERERRKRQAEQREAERQANMVRVKNFNSHIKKFLHLKFYLEDGIVIRPMKTLKEIEIAGDVLKHCIYQPSYYDNADSLLMCAYQDGKPLETTEISLKSFMVKQSRGIDNLDTIYTDKIVDILTEKMPLIKEAMKPKRKKRITKKKAA